MLTRPPDQSIWPVSERPQRGDHIFALKDGEVRLGRQQLSADFVAEVGDQKGAVFGGGGFDSHSGALSWEGPQARLWHPSRLRRPAAFECLSIGVR